MPDDMPITLLGEGAGWFAVDRDGDAIILRPRDRVPRRCTIRPVALFQHPREMIEANPTMGRILFPNGSEQPQRYRPFTKDPTRRLRALFLPVEAAPHDDGVTDSSRWRNFETVAKRLCQIADIPWNGLSDDEVDRLVRFVPWDWPEPLEGCLHHALVQHALDRGDCVIEIGVGAPSLRSKGGGSTRGGCIIEIGSYRGRSASMFALALRGLDSDFPIISVDPHEAEPLNLAHVRLSLEQLGEACRLVQIPRRSDDASQLLRPETASLIFIDGDHSYDQVVADFRNYRDLLAPGGIMAFHDYGCGEHNGVPEAHPGVRRAVDEHVMTDAEFRPLLLAHTLLAFEKHCR